MYTPQYFDDLEAETLGEEVEAPETEMEIEDEI